MVRSASLISQGEELHPFQVTNRCYVGYGYNEQYSMFHGNLVAVMTSPDLRNKADISKSIRPAMSDQRGKYQYTIQKHFDLDSHHSLGFANPLNRDITLRWAQHEQSCQVSVVS